jgi:dihydropteroate synthase
MIIGNTEFKEGKTYVMGILNVTPDSFSDGGRFLDLGQKGGYRSEQMDHILRKVEEMIGDGMDILDIGAESTRPGYTRISDEEEIERLLPVIRKVKENFDIPISVDTYKCGVARAVLQEGIGMLNDIWGLQAPEDQESHAMAKVIAEYDAACCLMHNRANTDYKDFLADTLNDLRKTLHIAEEAGIKKEKIVLDPGVGFAKDTQQNLLVIKELEVFKELGCFLLLGTSRKSVIGNTLNLPKDQREEGTLVTTVMAVMAGYMFVRVHDVKANKRAVLMTEAILNA